MGRALVRSAPVANELLRSFQPVLLVAHPHLWLAFFRGPQGQLIFRISRLLKIPFSGSAFVNDLLVCIRLSHMTRMLSPRSLSLVLSSNVVRTHYVSLLPSFLWLTTTRYMY